MKSRIKISSKSLIYDVFTVASGTVIAQIITILLTPIITRIYGPTAYGVLGVFMSMVSILGNTSALSYPQAIILPKYERDSYSLVKISILTSITTATFLFGVIILFSDSLTHIFNLHLIQNYLLLLPLVVVFSGLKQTFQQLNFRHKAFKVISLSTIIYTLVQNISKIVFGIFLPSSTTLIIISTFSILLQTIILLFKGVEVREYLKLPNFKVNKHDATVALEYKDFPLYKAPQTFFDSISQNFPVIILSIFFGPTISGFYTLAKSILNIPIALISKSVGDALYPRLSLTYNNNLSIRSLLIKSTFSLILIGIIPFGSIIIFGPFLFELVFGSSWVMAGNFARWMSVWLFFLFINRPVVTAIPVLKLQKKYLFFEIFTTIGKIAGLAVGVYLFNDPLIAIIYFSLIGGISNMVLIIKIISQTL